MWFDQVYALYLAFSPVEASVRRPPERASERGRFHPPRSFRIHLPATKHQQQTGSSDDETSRNGRSREVALGTVFVLGSQQVRVQRVRVT